MSAINKVKLIKSGKLSAEKNIRDFLDKIKKQNPKINAVLQINPEAILEAKEVDSKIKKGKAGKLAGLAIAVKSNINVKGLNVSCASKTLEDYKSGYNATVIEKIKAEDGIIIGMTNMDEFASGSGGENSAFGATKNPAAMDRIPGGSSSGSAASVAAGFCDIALGSDTGGSIRNPASHCGIVGMKPSYGKVSRYGLIDLAMSLDQIGCLAKNVEDAELLFDVIKGKDDKDASSLSFLEKETLVKEKSNKENKNSKNVKFGTVEIKADKEIQKVINNKIKELNLKIQDIDIKHIDLGIQTYYPINYVEFFSGTRKFDGRRYGKKIEDSCGEEVLRRILGGKKISEEEFAGRYYKKALDAKKIIENEFDKAFEKVDCIIMPVVPKLPHKLGEKISFEDEYAYDALSVLANLAEIPAISVPCGDVKGIPVGIQLLCKKGDDDFMLDIAKEF